MHAEFDKNINTFMTLFRQAVKLQAEHIVTLSKQQRELFITQKELKSENLSSDLDTEEWEHFLEQCELFDYQMKMARVYFKEHIKNVNKELGSFSSLWGNYIEQLAVNHFNNVMKDELAVHTYMQKIKRIWGKNKGVEIDVLALNDETAFLIEVKTQLKAEHITQILAVCEKFEAMFPEFSTLKLQPIMMCVNCEEEIVSLYKEKSIWIIQYQKEEHTTESPVWKWLHKA